MKKRFHRAGRIYKISRVFLPPGHKGTKNYNIIPFNLQITRVKGVLYLSFQKPQKAAESEMLDDGVLLRYKRDKLVGITIPDKKLSPRYMG